MSLNGANESSDPHGFDEKEESKSMGMNRPDFGLVPRGDASAATPTPLTVFGAGPHQQIGATLPSLGASPSLLQTALVSRLDQEKNPLLSGSFAGAAQSMAGGGVLSGLGQIGTGMMPLSLADLALSGSLSPSATLGGFAGFNPLLLSNPGRSDPTSSILAHESRIAEAYKMGQEEALRSVLASRLAFHQVAPPPVSNTAVPSVYGNVGSLSAAAMGLLGPSHQEQQSSVSPGGVNAPPPGSTSADVVNDASNTEALEMLGRTTLNRRKNNTPYFDASTLADPNPSVLKLRRSRGGVTEPFPEKLYRMLVDAEQTGLSDVISFYPHGRAFGIHKSERFVAEVMPQYFKQSRLSSFQRQLNLYGFTRINSGSDTGGYYHELFLRGRPGLSVHIKRVGVPQAEPRQRGVKAHDSIKTPDFYSMPPIQEASTNSLSS